MALNRNTANNAKTTIYTSTVLSSDLTFQVKTGTSTLFPTPPFRIVVEKKVGNTVAKREIMDCTLVNTGTDTFTVTRAVEACPISDTATSSSAVAQSFASGDFVSLAITSALYQEVNNKVDINAGVRSGFGTDKHVRVNRTTGLEEAKAVTNGVTLLSTDIVRVEKGAGGVYEDMPFSSFQGALTPQSTVFTDDYILGEAVVAGNALALFSRNQSTLAQQNLGDITADGTLWYPFISSGVSSNTITLDLTKVLSPADITVRIETDNAGVNSGTLVNANATVAKTAASISNGTNTITFPGSFTCGAIGTKYWIGITCPVNATNYYTMGVIRGLSTAIVTTNSTLTATGAGTFVNALTFTVNKLCYLSRVKFNSTPTGIGLTFKINAAAVGANILPYSIGAIDDETLFYQCIPGVTYTLDFYSGSGAGGFYYSSTGNSGRTDGTCTITSGTINAVDILGFVTSLPKMTTTLTPTETIVKANTYSPFASLVRGFAKSTGSAGALPSLESDFISSVPGLTVGESYMLGDTPGAISTGYNAINMRIGVAKKVQLLQSSVQGNVTPQYQIRNNIVYPYNGGVINGGGGASGNTSIGWSRDGDTFTTLYSITGGVCPNLIFHLPRGFIKITTTVSPLFYF